MNAGAAFALTGVDDLGGALTLLVHGEPAPVRHDSTGTAAAAPLFLDEATLWPAPPEEPVDLMLFAESCQSLVHFRKGGGPVDRFLSGPQKVQIGAVEHEQPQHLFRTSSLLKAAA